MKSFLILLSIFFACAIGHPALDYDEEIKIYTWIDDLVSTVFSKDCLFMCEETYSYLDDYIPVQLRNKLTNTAKDVTRTLLRYGLSNGN